MFHLFNYVFDRVNQKSPGTNRRPSVHSEGPSTSILMYFSLLQKLLVFVMVPVVEMYIHILFPKTINPLNAELNPICYLLALLGPRHFLHVRRIRVKSLTLRLLMSYIYIYIYIYIYDISSLRVKLSVHLRTPISKRLGTKPQKDADLWTQIPQSTPFVSVLFADTSEWNLIIFFFCRFV